MPTRRDAGREKGVRHTRCRFLGLAYIAEQGEEPEETNPPGRKFPRSLLPVYPVPLGRCGRAFQTGTASPSEGGVAGRGRGVGNLELHPQSLSKQPPVNMRPAWVPGRTKGLLMKQGMAAAHPTLHTHTNNAKLVDPNPCTAQAGDEATRTSCLSTRLSVP